MINKINVWKNCYKMKLGETINNVPEDNSLESLLRVPGGWVYYYGTTEGDTSVFAPYDEEFLPFKERRLI